MERCCCCRRGGRAQPRRRRPRRARAAADSSLLSRSSQLAASLANISRAAGGARLLPGSKAPRLQGREGPASVGSSEEGSRPARSSWWTLTSRATAARTASSRPKLNKSPKGASFPASRADCPRPDPVSLSFTRARVCACRYFMHGLCKEGDNCRYSHDLASSKPAAMVCKFFQRGHCAFGERCR